MCRLFKTTYLSRITKIKTFENVCFSNYDAEKKEASVFFLAVNGNIKKELPAPRKVEKGALEHIIKTKKGHMSIFPL